ncbi:hypothetical protein A0O32_0254 [Anoxybacillus flavithermus]|uniref:Uncharacterized protein n=1 Tax=Anoxybacillus flavithermus TaxID=33934 RepID=A0A178TQ72_9BACL|nr:hypothetical protein TAF16_0295 [Anoxybacillus flavithermus]OAO83807.1 hypothetical protein A0O32_0254 [Anoxybacillus flavithermus]
MAIGKLLFSIIVFCMMKFFIYYKQMGNNVQGCVYFFCKW